MARVRPPALRPPALRPRAARPRAAAGASLGRPLGPWAFAAVAFSSFGGPLALAALIGPGVIGGVARSAGVATLAGSVLFAAPLAVWLRYSRHINSAGGLYAFVEAAVGRRMALVQAAIWSVSYGLYLVYTTVQIVYDVLPAAVPGVRSYQTLLALLIPALIAAVMIAGRAAMLIVIGLMAAGQVALTGLLDGVTLAHLSIPASSFGSGVGAGSLAKASAQTSQLYVCGSLPLFLGGELRNPVGTIRRGLIGSFLLAAMLAVLALAPLAAAPGLLASAVPGVSVAQAFSGRALGEAIGIGVAVSTAGLIVLEYLALTRLLHAVGRWRPRPIAVAIGAAMVFAAPFTLVDPEGFYGSLIEPSLVALWVSQLIVFVAFPRFAAKYRERMAFAWPLSLAASAFAGYGIWTAVS